MKSKLLMDAQNLQKLLKNQSTVQQKRLTYLEGYDKVVLTLDRSKSGKEYYRIRYKGKSIKIKCKNKQFSSPRYLGKASDSESIMHKLPRTYHDEFIYFDESLDERAIEWKLKALEFRKRFIPPYPEGLIHKTMDGTYVRSKSELVIYNFLLQLGITFVYELPILTEDRVLWLDFTILSEFDYKTIIIIEHQGMMDNEQYRIKTGPRIYDYICAGFTPNVDVCFTFETIQNGIDMSVFQDILRLRVRRNL